MDRDNRRNSILKPFGNQLGIVEHEEEQTETFTFSRRKSMKRVSFAGRDEVKEFQKHEVLTVQKLEKALNQLQNDVEQKGATVSRSDSVSIMSDKENMAQVPLNFTEIMGSNDNYGEDDMEITSLVPSSIVTNISVHHTILATSVVEARDCKAKFEAKLPCLDGEKNVSQFQEISIEECEMITIESPEEIPLLPQADTVTSTTPLSSRLDPSNDIKQPVKENVIQNLEMKSGCLTKGCPNPSLQSIEMLPNKEVQLAPISNMVDFAESNEIANLFKDYQWQAKHSDGELILSKMFGCLILKLQLSFEFISENIQHFVVEDIEVETRKDIDDKWARFGFTVLETTLENCNLKSICSTTQSLPKLLHAVQEHCHTFLEYMIEDSQNFELLVNPRSLTLDIDRLLLSFDLSNLENLSWVRIALTLNPTFPLSAKNITIDHVMGHANKAELSNMVSTIRPNGRYLTRVAECIDDFLKFRPSVEVNVLDTTRDVNH